MKGTTLNFQLHDILLLIGIQGRSGELVIESGNNIGTLFFHKGNILQGFSPYSRAIGDLLVEDGLLTEEELMATLQLQKKSQYAPLGALLLKTGKVSLEVIESLVHTQIRQAIKEFTLWTNINYNFTDKEVNPYDRIHLHVHEFIPPVILQSATKFISEFPHSNN